MSACLTSQAVKEVTRLFEETPAGSYEPPSARTSNETDLSSSNEAHSEAWEDESDEGLMDVSDWTPKQVSGAFTGTVYSRVPAQEVSGRSANIS